jgi:hypothetical protein
VNLSRKYTPLPFITVRYEQNLANFWGNSGKMAERSKARKFAPRKLGVNFVLTSSQQLQVDFLSVELAGVATRVGVSFITRMQFAYSN